MVIWCYFYSPGLCKRNDISSGYSVAEFGPLEFLPDDKLVLEGDLKLEVELFAFVVGVKLVLGNPQFSIWDLVSRDLDDGVTVMEPEIHYKNMNYLSL